LERLAREPWFLAGLFLTTLATLALEILDTRLLSVLTWYHVSFFAVSTAMFGMSAGAVHVYLAGERFSQTAAPAALARWSFVFAVAVPVAHVVNLVIPLPVDISLTGITAIAVSTVALAVPFFISGIIVALALTRVPGRVGRIYATDLVGASLGCILVIPLLTHANISSATFALGALAALGSVCFRRFAGARRMFSAFGLAVALIALALLNGLTHLGFRVMYPKGRFQPALSVSFEAWNTYSQVVAGLPASVKPFYWGPGSKAADDERVMLILMSIDGEAGTMATQWNGQPASLGWTQHDVTSLPYHLRHDGDAAVIGVGGGRDVLTAIWGRSHSVTGIEMNEALVRLLKGPLRRFTAIADRPEIELVHDEARSYLTRTAKRFDVLQMSLIDTWAATGAGAYTLSENGLYTLEAWRVFLGVLKPGGIFSVSRWFSPNMVSETTRLVALATNALLDRGMADPGRHLALVARDRVATLLVGEQPLSDSDLDEIEKVAVAEDFTILFTARHPAKKVLGAVFASRSRAELDAAIANQPYDYSPPTDVRPYFFNMLRLRSLHPNEIASSQGVVAAGNLLATLTLAVLGAVSAALVVSTILWPLWRAGTPRMPPRAFACAVSYFSLIGIGFMMMQIPYMQRFSVYLGHPTYAIAVILFSMILSSGIGSWLSDRLSVERQPQWVIVVPLLAAAGIAVAAASMEAVIASTVRLQLAARCMIVCALTAPPALLLGFCFPIGMRLVRDVGEGVMPWMWGVNGACGVLASVLAVAISMWAGIPASLYVAIACYALLPLPARVLASVRSTAEERAAKVVGALAR
jgi:spermidine synthase